MDLKQQMIDIIESHTSGKYYGQDSGGIDFYADDVDPEAMADELLTLLDLKAVARLFNGCRVAEIPNELMENEIDAARVRVVIKVMGELAK